MAKPIAFPEATGVLEKPPCMSDGECAPLPVYRGAGEYVSCWQPSDEERRAIAAGRPIWLHIIGNGHPPVRVTAEFPFAPGDVGQPEGAPTQTPGDLLVPAEPVSDRDGVIEEIFELARQMARFGLELTVASARDRLMAVYVAATAISRGFRTVMLHEGDQKAIESLDALAHDVSVRFAEDMPAGDSEVPLG